MLSTAPRRCGQSSRRRGRARSAAARTAAGRARRDGQSRGRGAGEAGATNSAAEAAARGGIALGTEGAIRRAGGRRGQQGRRARAQRWKGPAFAADPFSRYDLIARFVTQSTPRVSVPGGALSFSKSRASCYVF